MAETDTALRGKVKNIVVLASGNGSNLQAIIDAMDRGEINARISALITNNPDAYVLKRARKHGVPSVLIKPTGFGSRKEYNDALLEVLTRMDPDLIVLAGYMLLLGERIVRKFKGRIINIHPALLPSFKGTHGIRDAFEYGVKITGVTVHFVDEGMDTGEIIAQEAVAVLDDDTLEALEERIHKVEHKLYPHIIAELLDGKLERKGK